MFSKLFYIILQYSVLLFSLGGSIPWSWNFKTKRLCIRKFQKIWNRIATCILASFALFCMVRTIQAKQRDIHQFLIAVGMTFFCLLETLNMLLMSIYAEDVLPFINGMLDYSVTFQSKYMQFTKSFTSYYCCLIQLIEQWIPHYDSDNKVNYYFDRMLILSILSLLGIAPIVFLHYLVFPLDMIYPNSILPGDWGTHWLIYWGNAPCM